MDIQSWSGDWSLPSVEFNCLQVLSLVKFVDAQAEIRYTNNPFNTPDGHLPCVKFSEKHLRKFEDVRKFLIDKNYCPDLDLNAKQLAESLALRTMVEEKLYPALRYTWWIDSKNYEKFTRPWYAKALRFPLNFYYPARYKQENEDIINSLYQDMDIADIEVLIYREAEKCLTCLSNRLGSNDFFYGSSPSSLDAIVYGCLAPLMKAPFPSNVLQNHAKASTNLFKFVSRITQRYFFHELQDYERKLRETETTKPEKSSDFLPHKRRNQILAVMFAVVASFTYGIVNEIFTISFSNGKDIESEVYDDDVYFETET